MKNFKKFNFILFIVLFIYVFLGAPIINVQATNSYKPGDLLSKIGSSEIYLIGLDNKKYIFPDVKTYLTWQDHFMYVQKVPTSDLDLFVDGGAVTYRPGTKLLKHQDSAKVFAIEPGGVARWIASPTIAKNLYGDNWAGLVQDIDPGIFVTNYKEGHMISDLLPTGTLVKSPDSNAVWYINDGMRRLFLSEGSFSVNNFQEKDIITINNLSNYILADSIVGRETPLFYYLATKKFVHPNYNFSFYYPSNYNVDVVSDDYILFRDIVSGEADFTIKIENKSSDPFGSSFANFAKDRAVANCDADGVNGRVYCEYLSTVNMATVGDNYVNELKINLNQFTETMQNTTSRSIAVYGIDLTGDNNSQTKALLLSSNLDFDKNHFARIMLDHFRFTNN